MVRLTEEERNLLFSALCEMEDTSRDELDSGTCGTELKEYYVNKLRVIEGLYTKLFKPQPDLKLVK